MNNTVSEYFLKISGLWPNATGFYALLHVWICSHFQARFEANYYMKRLLNAALVSKIYVYELFTVTLPFNSVTYL